ncbi:MAG: EAL domain-containing protein, partial [Oscillospiraceae bacterium]|nr:EAL domain-containing protein [Oscillospiraceae bacterium]
RITGAEALCRWNHAERGWIPPSKFIPALEEAGMIYDLDCFVWEQVCRDLHRWKEAGKILTASVNLSRADFSKNQDLPAFFRDLIRQYALSPEQLHLEITETAYVDSPDLLIPNSKQFREYGFQVEMDDFGSGYSSLNMLKEVQVDRIKLDLHFLTETGDPEKGRIIVQHMILMAQALGMSLIAEGVEREEQAQFLHKHGCKEMQGYFYYKPMASDAYERLNGISG